MTVPAPRTANQHISALDGVRGLAILLVLVHTFVSIARPGEGGVVGVLEAMAMPGWTGVQLFFVLSGFLITGRLLAARGGADYFRSFYIRRTLRIFPLYYATLSVALVILPRVGLFPGWRIDAMRHAIWYWTYTSNWVNPFGIGIPGLSHFWSLAVEEQFYLVWPAVVLVVDRRRLALLCVASLVGGPLIRALMVHAGLPPLTTYEFSVARWDALSAGALLAILTSDAAGRRQLVLAMPWLVALSLSGLAIVLGVAGTFGPTEPVVAVAGQTIAALLAMALVRAAAGEGVGARGEGDANGRQGANATAARLMRAGWLRTLGKYSYAIYVFHLPIHTFAIWYLTGAIDGGVGWGHVARLVAYVAVAGGLSVVAAMISWRVLERPLLELKDRLAPLGTVPQAPRSAAAAIPA